MQLRNITVFEDQDLIVVNKPAGLLSIPDRKGKEISLKEILQQEYGDIFTVHRLDKETSGLIVFAKTGDTHKKLSQQFEQRETKKIYLGLVLGSLVEKNGAIDAPIAEHPSKKGTMIVHRKGKPSLTEFTVLEAFGLFTWMQFRIHTGRTHQIRVHLKHIGHPIACDDLYGDGKPIFLSSIKHRYKISKNQEEEKPILDRLALHASFLSCKINDTRLEVEAPVPKDLKALLNQLRKWKK